MSKELSKNWLKIVFTSFGYALTFLTIIPWFPHTMRMTQKQPLLVVSMVFWPVIGAVMAYILAQIDCFFIACYTPPILASILAWGVVIFLTGGLHEDGWGDVCDSLGGRDKQQRLAIMRDSRVGSFGVLGLILLMAFRVTLLAYIPPHFVLPICLASMVPAYQAMALTPSFLMPARDNGLGASLKEIPAYIQCLCLITSFSLGVLLPWYEMSTFLPFYLWGVFPLILLLCTGLCVALSLKLFGGFTGDVLGSLCVITQCIFFLVYFIALNIMLVSPFIRSI